MTDPSPPEHDSGTDRPAEPTTSEPTTVDPVPESPTATASPEVTTPAAVEPITVTSVDEPDGAEPVVLKAEPVPMRPVGRYQQAFWFVLLLATAVALGGASITAGAFTADGQPDTVVREYFAALENGDAAAALGYGTVPKGRLALVSPAALAAQNATGQIVGLSVGRIGRIGHNRAEVHVGYTVDLRSGPVAESDVVDVVRHGHGWRLAHSALDELITPGAAGNLARLDGAAVPNGQYLMFPGAVPVTYVTPNLRLADLSSTVSFGDGGDLTVDAAVTAAGRQAITPLLRAALASCLAGTAKAEGQCPLPKAPVSVPGSLRGSLTGTSTDLTFRVDRTGGTITVSGTFPVTAKYQTLDPNNIESTKTTKFTPVFATCYAAGPGTVWWRTS